MSRPVHGGNLNWAAFIAGCSPSSIVDFSASINPLGPPRSAIDAIQRGLKELSAYPDPNYSQLRLALSAWHSVPPEWILPGNGAAELLTWAGWELSQQDVTYLPTPAFSDYGRALRAFGAEIRNCPLNIQNSPRNPLRVAHPPETKKGLLLNNPHNPTGTLWTVEEILPYLDSFDLVVVDEAFMDFLAPSEQESLIPFVQDYSNLVIVRSLTKFYSLPGLRLGYAISHPDRLQQWQKLRDPWSVNVLAAAAGEAVIQDTTFQQQTWDWLQPTRSKLFTGLASLKGLQPLESSANFLLVKTAMSSTQLQETLLKQHQILIRDCLSFPELGDHYFRVAVRSETENQRLLEGLASIL